MIFKILRVNSKIGPFKFSWSEIFSLEVIFGLGLVMLEVLEDDLYLFLSEHVSRVCSDDPQYEEKFSILLLLLSFSSIVSGPWNLDLDGFFIWDEVFFSSFY